MKRLVSMLFALLLAVGIQPSVGVSAKATPSLQGKLYVGGIGEAIVSLDTTESLTIVGETEDGKYLYPRVVKNKDGGVSILYYLDTDTGTARNEVKGVSTLEALKADIISNASKYGKTPAKGSVYIDIGMISKFVFFSSNGTYLATEKVSDMKDYKYDLTSSDFKGVLGVEVSPVKKESAKAVITYDFSAYPTCLGGEFIESFAVCSKDVAEAKGESTDALTDTDAEYVVSDANSADYLDEDSDTAMTTGKTSAITLKKNGTYVVTLQTNVGEYKKEFTVSNIAEEKHKLDTKTAKVGKAPSVTFSKLPKSTDRGTTLKVTMYISKKSKVSFNGDSTSKYVTKKTFEITDNGNYDYTAVSKDGGTKSGVLKVRCFKDATAKELSMDNYFGDENNQSNTSTTLPQTGKSGIGIIVGGIISIVVGICIIFRKKLITMFGGVINAKK